MTSLKIQQLDPIEHILKRPDMYVGSTRPKKSEEYVYVDGALQKKTILYPPALLRIFIEALSNATDNVQRSKEVNVACTKIKVKIDKETGETSIWNDGFVIPIEQESSSKYKHTLIFGELRTSTNFDDTEERTVSGRNGLGIKLLNVFSKKFTVKGVDPALKKQFVQEWSNNMRTITPPKITSTSLKTGFTEVSWIPDFEAFGLTAYSDDIFNLYLRYVVDAAMLTKLVVYINDEKLPVKSLQDYARLFTAPTNELCYFKGEDSEVVVATASEFEAISFVNGVFTMHGGKHVDSWTEAIFRPIVEHYTKPKKPSINIKEVKQFYRLFIVSTLVNPEFTNQSKTELSSPDVKAIVEKKTISSILRWEHTKCIADVINAKDLVTLKKLDVKSRSFKAVEGYEPANEAGNKHRSDCTLALCEGLSAKTFAIKGMKSELFGKSGRDWFGVYALRGKILNVIKSRPDLIAENKVIKDIIQILNLKQSTDYTRDENFKQLNYGRLLILTDADTDGKHIAGLILTLIHHLFPTLLERTTPFLVDMLTPIAKFSIGRDIGASAPQRSDSSLRDIDHVFYDLHSADEFYKANAQSKKIEVRYYKGLGSHSNDEITDVFGKRVISYIKDEQAHFSIHKAFGKETEPRKLWMEEYDPKCHTPIDEETLRESITHFIDESFINFPIDDCKRSIPNIIDGLKQSQRKILYACFLRGLVKSLKVAQLAGFVAEKTNYHHGEQNLHETITKMANEFVGSNNIPLLYRDGQFGSRSEGGKDAANARYIFTKLESITRFIFREEDDSLLERVVDDGDIVEPVYYVPIIPMILVNGADGIGTGWSSSIPLHNPLDVVNLVKTWIKTSDSGISIIDSITPWYRGFKGVIKDNEKGTGFVTEGIVTVIEGGGDVEITEIPVGMKIQDLQEILDKMREDKKIKGYKNYSTADQPHYIVTPLIDGVDLASKLRSSLATTNMVLFDRNGKIKKYNTVEDIIEEFCIVRLEFYNLRKSNLIKTTTHKILLATNKKRFIDKVMDGEIVLYRKKTDDINTLLSEHGFDGDENAFDFAYLLHLQIGTFTLEKIEKLEETIETLKAELELAKNLNVKEMWLKDLAEFEQKYAKWIIELVEPLKDEKVGKGKGKGNLNASYNVKR